MLGKIRDRFGGNLKVSFVGGAATSMEVLNFFENINIKILEGYGLTETSPLVTVNTPEQVDAYFTLIATKEKERANVSGRLFSSLDRCCRFTPVDPIVAHPSQAS